MNDHMQKVLAAVCRICPLCILRRRWPDSFYGRLMSYVERCCPFCLAYDVLIRKQVQDTQERLEARRKVFLKHGFDQARAVDYVIGFVPAGAGPLLDVGTGRGHLAVALARVGHQLTSIDIDPAMTASARLNAAYYGVSGSIRFLNRKAHRSGFPSDYFGVICCMSALHHFGKSYMTLDEMIRILRPGGALVLADFDEEGFDILEKVHALDGMKHPRPGIDMQKAQDYLKTIKNLTVSRAEGERQIVLFVRKGAV